MTYLAQCEKLYTVVDCFLISLSALAAEALAADVAVVFGLSGPKTVGISSTEDLLIVSLHS